MLITTLEWAGSFLGLLGAYLLASHSRVSRYGWLAFLAANIATMSFAFGIERYGLFVQQVGFMGTSLLGLWRSGLWQENAEMTATHPPGSGSLGQS